MKKIIFLLLALSLVVSCKSKKIVTSKDVINENLSEKKVDKSISTFNYKKPIPVKGKLRSVVELGASGFNFFIVNIDKNKNYEIKHSEYGSSLFIEGKINPNDINKRLKNYIRKIRKFKVKAKDIHFVMSSGAKMSKLSKTVIKQLKSIGYLVNEITADAEGKFALKAALPNNFKNSAYVVDIGSGNTKISYLIKNRIISNETYGAKYFQNKIADADVYEQVKKIASNVPKEKQSLCFIIGGVPYQMAKSARVDKENYTVLNYDTNIYKDLIKDKGEKVASGINIFKGIVDGTNCKKFVFTWDGNFTIGFLLALEK